VYEQRQSRAIVLITTRNSKVVEVAAEIASEMPAAIRPYSIAVAPDSSDKKFKKALQLCLQWVVIHTRRHSLAP
jgi:hypothetical protein